MYVEIDSKDFLIKALKDSELTNVLNRQDNKYFGTEFTEEQYIQEISSKYSRGRNIVYIDVPKVDFFAKHIAALCVKHNVRHRLCPENDKELDEVIRVNSKHPELTYWVEVG